MISSAKHSAMVFIFLKAWSLDPLQMLLIAWLTLLRGETSTACFLTTPPEPILVESSRAPAIITAPTKTSSGLRPVRMWIISKQCFTILIAISFLPEFLPWNYIEPTRRSTIGQRAFLNFLTW